MTKVKFYNINGEVLAVFPETIGEGGHISCYAHIGQHSELVKPYLKGKKLASPSEYADLLRELKGQGYDDLIVINNQIKQP